MITNKQIEELYKDNKVKKHEHFYYYSDIDATLENILKVNDLQIALSEWWEVYHSRQSQLDENCIPIITLEECYSMGL